MFERINDFFVKKVDINELKDLKNYFSRFRANCKNGYTVVVRLKNGEYIELDNFNLCESSESDLVMKDETQILIKGWISVIKFKDNYYHLFPLNSGNFGFYHGIKDPNNLLYLSSKIMMRSSVKKYFVVEGSMFYEVEEVSFDSEDPFTFNLIDDKPTMVFQKDTECGILSENKFYSTIGGARTKIHPIAEWILKNNN